MKDFNRQKVVLFLIAAALGFLFKTLNVPIPYMLGGIVVTFVAKTFFDPKTHWTAAWRNFMLSIGGVEIGRDCSFETLVNLSNQVFGVLSATGSIVVVSLIASWLTFRFCNVNLISCFMGCAPGGMSLMTLMAEEDPRSDMNFVVVAQTLRFTCVVVSVPFPAMHMLDENATAVALEQGELLSWLVLIPLVCRDVSSGKNFTCRQNSCRGHETSLDTSEFAFRQRGNDCNKRRNGGVLVAHLRLFADNGVPCNGTRRHR